MHYIHQHVHLHQRPSYCDQCKSHLNSDEDSTPALKPPNIQISFISDDSREPFKHFYVLLKLNMQTGRKIIVKVLQITASADSTSEI